MLRTDYERIFLGSSCFALGCAAQQPKDTLVIESGEAWLSHADCPDSLCVKQGKIHANGQVITCLPNKLTVTVYGGDKNEVDLVS